MENSEQVGATQKPKLRKNTEEYIPELQTALGAGQAQAANLAQFADIVREWNLLFSNEFKAITNYTFKAEFPRLVSYKDRLEVAKKFDSLGHFNSLKNRVNLFEKSIFVLVRVNDYDDIHKVVYALC